MSRRDADISVVLFFVTIIIGGFVALALLGGIYFIISVFFILFVSVSLIVFGAHKYLLREAEAAESMVDEEEVEEFIDYDQMSVLKAGDVESKKPVLSCPHCGYENPADADFCIRCGRDLDVTDDVARY